MELLNRNWVGLTVFVSASLLLMGIACAQQVQILSPGWDHRQAGADHRCHHCSRLFRVVASPFFG